MSLLRNFLLVAVASTFVTSAFADPKQYYFERYRQARQRFSDSQGLLRPFDAQELHFAQRLDHDNAEDTRTFDQRYYVVSDFARSSNAPVFLYICGEAACTDRSGFPGALQAYARTFHAVMVAVEHRYYGTSQPFDRLTRENLRYLSTDAALKDLANLQRHLTEERGFAGPWVAFGGSYSGSLAAYYRSRYPDLVVGAVASSGPVIADANFEEYDRHVAEVFGNECAEHVRTVVRTAEEAAQNPEVLEAMKARFEAQALTETDDFLYLIADMAALAAQYGYRDRFCSMLSRGPDLVEAYAQFTKEIFQSWGMDALTMSAAGALDEDPAVYDDFGMRQWYYQSCTEYGYWQNAYHDPHLSVRSARISPEYHTRLCQRLFGMNGSELDTDAHNRTYYDPLLTDASRVFFTNGSEDPWSLLSITDPGLNDDLGVYVIAGAAHCDDLAAGTTADSTELRQARTRVEQALRAWVGRRRH